MLLAATLVYCIVLERRLTAVRKGQEGLKHTIGELNASIETAAASLRALQSAAGSAAKLSTARSQARAPAIDELSLVTASGERIAQRMERSSTARAKPSRSGAHDERTSSVRQRHEPSRRVEGCR